MLTVREVAALLGMTKGRILYRIRWYHLPHLVVGQTFLVDPADIANAPLWLRIPRGKHDA